MVTWIILFIFASGLMRFLAASRSRRSDRDIAQSRIDTRLAEIQRRREQAESGDDFPPRRRRSRRR